MLFATLGLISVSFEENLGAELAKIVSPKAVAYVKSETEKGYGDKNRIYTFLDSKGDATGRMTATESLKSVQISPDGTMAVAVIQGYSLTPFKQWTDFVLANKDGMVANLHVNSIADLRWQNDRLVLFGHDTPLSIWGPSVTGAWTAVPFSTNKCTSLIIDGDTYLTNTPDAPAMPNWFYRIDLSGIQTKAMKSDMYGRDILVKQPGSHFFYTKVLLGGGDGMGPVFRLSIWDLETKGEHPISDAMDGADGLWFSGVKSLGFIERQRGSNNQFALFSPANGKIQRLGPNDLFGASCALLNADTAIIVDFRGKVFSINPETKAVKRLKIRDVPSPTCVRSCL